MLLLILLNILVFLTPIQEQNIRQTTVKSITMYPIVTIHFQLLSKFEST